MAPKPATSSKPSSKPASAPATGGAKIGAKPVSQEVPEWKKALYAPARLNQAAKGAITFQELHGITGPEMLEMAVTGFSMYEQGRYQQAKVIFEGLAALDPKEAYYRTALGAVLLAEGTLDKAVAALDEALKLDAKDLAAYVNRGEAHLRKGDSVKAALDFKKSVQLDPQGKDPLTHRARALGAAVLRSIEVAESGSKASASAKGTKPAAPAPKGKPGKR